MNIESVVGTLVGQFNQRLFDLPPSQAPVELPPPRTAHPYLLYLHVPFCRALCPFCTFHRVQFDDRAAASYFDVLEAEIQRVSDAGYSFDEMYVGGGTPTVMPARLLDLIGRLRGEYGVRSASIETNPNELDRQQLEAFAAAGVSRLSVGVQSFDDSLLEGMQRKKTYGDGEQIVTRLGSAAGIFDTLNVDMIFNLPGQSEASLQRDLDILLDELAVDQVSYYPLMSTPETRAAMQRTMGDTDHVRERNLYERIAARMAAAGYTRNSAWCFSRRPGMFDEYIVDREEYLGLGAGAFSYLEGSLYASTFSHDQYAALVAGGGTGTVLRKSMTLRDQMRYYLLTKLFGGRLRLGVAEARFKHAFRRTLAPELAGLKLMGAARERADTLELTERGFYLWVVLMREFFTGINRLRQNMRHVARRAPAFAQAGE